MSDTWDSAPLAPKAPEAPAAGLWNSAPIVGTTPQQKAVVSSNDNGEEAARALQIGKKTGIPATVVQGDLPGYAEHQRAQAAKRAVENPYLAKYVDNNPMAAKVSSDDWDHAEEVSKTLQALSPELVKGKASVGVFGGIAEVNNLLASPPGRQKLLDALKQLPGAIAHGLLDFVQTPGKVASGEINLTTPQGLDQGIGFGLGVALGTRDIRVGPKGDAAPGVGTPADVDAFLAKVRGAKTRQEINDFLASKQDGPPGAMLQIEHAKAGSEALDRAVEVAQASKTKARSPEMFEELAKAHDDGVLHIDARKVVELYEKAGKAPVEGDGLFGFVPDLASRVQAAAAAGGEISIPISKYIAHIDPTVHEGLKESVRLHDDGVTLEEAETAKETVKSFDPETRLSRPEEGKIRFYHGTLSEDASTFTGQTFVTPQFNYARDYHGNTNNVLFTDLTKEEAIKRGLYDEVNDIPINGAIDDGASILKPVKQTAKPKTDDPVSSAVETAAETEKLFLGLKTEPFMNMLFKDAKSIGITEAEFKKYSDKIANQEAMILDRAVATGKREAAKYLTPEWKRNEAAINAEVAQELQTAGAFAAEKYLREQKIDIAHERAAQVADDLAPIFGFETGQDLLRGLEAIDIEKAASGKGPQVQLRDAIKAETAARMEERYGNLAENIAKEAREIALADHTFDILADEVRILADAAGVSPPLSRAELVDWAQQNFEASNIRDATNWEKLRRAVERGGREAEKALLKGDFLEAFQAKQRQMLAATLAKESLKLQEVVDRAERKIDRFLSEEAIKGIDQAYLEQIRQMLASVGMPQQFAPLRDTGTLRDFVAESERQLAVAPWLMDGSQPKLQDMSVGQFREFVDSMKSLEHVGRQAQTLASAMDQAELQNVIFDVKKELDRFDLVKQPLNPTVLQRAKAMTRFVTAAHLLVEKMLDYTDKFNPEGPLTKWLDRPLRDSNTKEIQLTERTSKQLRDLAQYTDSSINDIIPQKLIFDQLTNTWLNMDRGNLRQLAMYMGARENVVKVIDGFGVNEADVRRLLNDQMTQKDWKWVEGMWKIFADLHVDAAEMVLRDTGVPLSQKTAVPLTTKWGEVSGGYAPLIYDRARSNIQGDIAAKNPTFKPEFFTPATAHGYTEALTQYAGFLDLTGIQTAPKIMTMIHDIAFREAVRNASKLINNEEFMAAMTQKWSAEYAGLLPGWLRDIANVKNVDDQYAVGAARVMAGLRNNITSALIAFNPGTYMKHGGTAAAMSVRQVGAMELAKAAKDLGIRSIWENARDLVQSTDARPTPEFVDALQEVTDQGMKGEAVREFILASSAVMRNRQRKAADSIRGAYETASESGPLQTAKDARHFMMNLGRVPVALTDTMSAMPTWLAAYKKAMAEGAEHADAVFVADKEMSRAHGSNFVGDKPRVMRTGEPMRWITPLYNFWNHNFNNHLQMAWDASARMGGRAEPGADWGKIAHAMFWVSVVPIIVHELAAPAKDEHGAPVGAQMLKAVAQHYGSMIIGLRDISNAALNGYDPSIGTLGTVSQILKNTGRDIKNTAAGRQARDGIAHGLTMLGALTGIGGQSPGKAIQFGVDVARGRERPRGQADWRQGLRTGHAKARKH